MTISQPIKNDLDIKQIPAQREEREAIRRLAAEMASTMEHQRPPTREALEAVAGQVLARLGYAQALLGFAMVAVSNAFWRAQFAAVPYTRRLLLLPHCLSDTAACQGAYDSVGLHCAGCGCCELDTLQRHAEDLGYQVIVAEGTTSVIMKVLEGEADAILGVACLDSLEKSFIRIADLGIPHLAVPLLKDGCVATQAEGEQILVELAQRSAPVTAVTESFLPLLRETRTLCTDEGIAVLLADTHRTMNMAPSHPLYATEQIARDWLQHGGKRLRPFITLAGYAVARHGDAALRADADFSAILPPAVRRIALAIEALHKASLVHDDIEDDDAYRYGRPTLHRQYGVPAAINIGDYLVGLGYELVLSATDDLGSVCTTAILRRLSAAHLALCRGQGAELLWSCWQQRPLQSRDVLAIYAQKTAPAFEVALYAGLRAAGLAVDEAWLARFATYLGEGFQILNDLEDWQQDVGNKLVRGGDVLASRPTILQAFAIEAGGAARLAALPLRDHDAYLAGMEALYSELGVFTKAERLVERLRERALHLAGEAEGAAVPHFLRFLVRMVLQRKVVHEEPGR